jgi:hypothetical protein
MKSFFALALIFANVTPALAWFDKGHMVVAQLAWKKLDEGQRARIVALLKKHPHCEEFLTAKRPEGIAADEWIFLRAATWPDWVKNHHQREFYHGAWHYINYPFVPPHSHLPARCYRPKEEGEDILQALKNSIQKIEKGADEEKAVYLCWLLHLVGDIHQPLHCTQMVSEQFPQGDQGGNLVLIRTRDSVTPIRLHIFWDGLLGTSLTAGSIGKDSVEIEAILKDKAATIQPELDEHKTFESWAKEGYELAKKSAYLNGELKFVRVRENFERDDVPETPAEYAANAGRIARIQIGKAGVRLTQQLTRLFPRE